MKAHKLAVGYASLFQQVPRLEAIAINGILSSQVRAKTANGWLGEKVVV